MPKVHILFAANDAFAMPMAIAAHSALYHLDVACDVEVHILDEDISEDNRRRAQFVLSEVHPRATVCWRKADLRDFSSVNVRHYSKSSMARLLVSHLFDQTVERVLYLDSDLIVNDDLSQLWDLDLGEQAIWAVQDGDDEDFETFVRKKFPKIQATSNARYFNAGVLLINLSEWRSRKVSERALDFVRENHDLLSFPDQDTLNAIAGGDWGRLEARWNKQITRIGRPESCPIDWPGILHYTSYKPWHSDYSWPAGVKFHRAYLRSGWEGFSKALLRVLSLQAQQMYHKNRNRISRRLGF